MRHGVVCDRKRVLDGRYVLLEEEKLLKARKLKSSEALHFLKSSEAERRLKSEKIEDRQRGRRLSRSAEPFGEPDGARPRVRAQARCLSRAGAAG